MKDVDHSADTGEADTQAHDDANATELASGARDILDEAVDSVPDDSSGDVKSRDPEYYGDR